MKSLSCIVAITSIVGTSQAFTTPMNQGKAATMVKLTNSDTKESINNNRRVLLGGFVGALTTIAIQQPDIALADVDVDDYLRSGMVSMPMGVSGQAGKRYDKASGHLKPQISLRGSQKNNYCCTGRLIWLYAEISQRHFFHSRLLYCHKSFSHS